MNHFIKEFLTILPVLGVEVFRGRSSKWDDALKAGEELQYDSPIFQVSVKKHGGTAYGQIIDGEFTVLKGSAIAAEVTRKDNVVESTRRQFELRKQLHERFSSPSAAAAFVQGRATANGRREWRTKDNDTYADWEGRK